MHKKISFLLLLIAVIFAQVGFRPSLAALQDSNQSVDKKTAEKTPAQTLYPTYTPLPTYTALPVSTPFLSYTPEPDKPVSGIPTSIFSFWGNQGNKETPQDEISVNWDSTQSIALNDFLLGQLTTFIQNVDVNLTYEDIKRSFMGAQNLLNYWGTYNFEELQKEFSRKNRDLILQLAGEEFPGKMLQSLFTFAQSMGISELTQTKTENRFFLPISETEFVYFPYFSIKISGNNALLFDLDGKKLGKMQKNFDADEPDQISFSLKGYQNDKSKRITLFANDSELKLSVDSEEILLIRMNPETQTICIQEKLASTQVKVSFIPEASTVVLSLAENGIQQSVKILLDKQNHRIACSFMDNELFSVVFMNDSQIFIELADKFYLLTFDDLNHQINLVPGNKAESELQLRFSSEKNLISLDSAMFDGEMESLSAIQFDKKNSSITLLIKDSPVLSFAFNQNFKLMTVSQGFSGVVFDQGAAEKLLTNIFGFRGFNLGYSLPGGTFNWY